MNTFLCSPEMKGSLPQLCCEPKFFQREFSAFKHTFFSQCSSFSSSLVAAAGVADRLTGTLGTDGR